MPEVVQPRAAIRAGPHLEPAACAYAGIEGFQGDGEGCLPEPTLFSLESNSRALRGTYIFVSRIRAPTRKDKERDL
jgi:hypothetical protein